MAKTDATIDTIFTNSITTDKLCYLLEGDQKVESQAFWSSIINTIKTEGVYDVDNVTVTVTSV